MADAYETPMPPMSPHIVVSDATAAIDFYVRAFGAKELVRHMAPDGKRVMHCGLLLANGGMLMLSDDFPEYMGGVRRAPGPDSVPAVMLHLQVTDADSVYNQAVAAGATPTMPLMDMFWGDRYGKLRDPFHHEWSIGAAIRKVTEDEVNAAIKSFSAKS